MSLMWNKVFWAFFSVSEALAILLSIYQSFQYFIAGAAMLPLALWKLAEDVEINSGKTKLVRRSILRKLKKRPQL
jgi:hypothetical protein